MIYEGVMAIRRPKEDEAREERLEMEVVVDAYGPEERAMGSHWGGSHWGQILSLDISG
jgi:hypothetical protein